MALYPPPLNEQDAAALTAVCQSCHATDQLIQDCKECGLPMDDKEAQNNAQKQYAQTTLRKFFPMLPQ
jgi:uncharacterized membrane protein YvbJ